MGRGVGSGVGKGVVRGVLEMEKSVRLMSVMSSLLLRPAAGLLSCWSSERQYFFIFEFNFYLENISVKFTA